MAIGSALVFLLSSRVSNSMLKIGPTKLKIDIWSMGPMVSRCDYSEHVMVETSVTQTTSVTVGTTVAGESVLFTKNLTVARIKFLIKNR